MKTYDMFIETQSQLFKTSKETKEALIILENHLRQKGHKIINKIIAKTGKYYYFKIISHTLILLDNEKGKENE